MNKVKKDKVKRVALVVAGLGVGAFNGLLGGGGGMITVPALRVLGGLSTKKAHATAIAVMLPLSVLSAVIYSVSGVYNLRLGLASCGAVAVGGIVGAGLLSRLRSNVLAMLFYTMMTAAGVYSIVRWCG